MPPAKARAKSGARRLAIVAGVAILVAVFLLVIWSSRAMRPFDAEPVRIMGTQTRLRVVARSYQAGLAAGALGAAEAALRDVEAHVSRYISASELSRLNAAGADQFVALSPTTMDVLRLSRELARRTKGAFDVTYRPVFWSWSHAGKQNRLPTNDELAAARANCGWDKIELLDGGATKRTAAAAVDLGGIAKGYGIDRATEAMIRSGAAGGLVNVGGDVRCFGEAPDGGNWIVGVRDPFDKGKIFAKISLSEGAICTSGNYERYTEIGERRYSHIVDPRTARPVDFAPSVTVVAPTAAAADAWATALSVLGREGFELLPKDARLEAMIVEGTPEEFRIRYTPGFRKLMISGPDDPVGRGAGDSEGG